MTSRSPQRRMRSSRRYREFREVMLRRLGDVCWICNHPGATDLDHVVPAAVDPGRMLDPSNVRPAHGVDGCAFCPPIVTRNGVRRRACNQSRGMDRVRQTAALGVAADGRADLPADPKGCARCHGERCSNGVLAESGMRSRCW